MKKCNLLIVVFFLILSVGAQSKKKKELFKLFVSVETYIQQIDSIPHKTGQGSFDSIMTYVDISERLQSQQKTFQTIIQKSKEVKIYHLFFPKLDLQWSITKSSMKSLVEATKIQQHYTNLIPKGTVLHIAKDTLPDSLNKWKPEQMPEESLIGLRTWKEPFDPWANDIYQYNLRPSLEYSSIVSLMIEYRRFRNAYIDLKATVPKRWLKKMVKNKAK